MNEEKLISQRYKNIECFLNERQKRLLLANEAMLIGYGGISRVSRATGISRPVLHAGIKEIKGRELGVFDVKRVRSKGGGRKKTLEKDKTLQADLEKLVEPVTRGDPCGPLRWTCKSTRTLSNELKAQGHVTSHRMVSELLHAQHYSLQGNRKTQEGSSSLDRDAQFHYINEKVNKQLELGEPVISVDTKKKELVGNYKNAGRVWRPQGKPEEVKVHDFVDSQLGRANPYGVYDLGENQGWVSVGTDHDTASFAVATIRRWWNAIGKIRYPQAKKITITADGGGSNGSRVRLWKYELQKFSDEAQLSIQVCHLPPGTSKWNKIEHRLFSFISMNWKGQPLVSHEIIISLIASTKTASGLNVYAELDTTKYPLGVKISDHEMTLLNMSKDPFHGEWNYCFHPRTPL